jgi:2-(1,2-epoxy-1,2-dihydrophenyl)acetyl-CoA isomerase
VSDQIHTQTSQPVLYDVDAGVATLTLNRPEAMNSLDVATKVALVEAVTAAADDPAVRCVVLTGTGRAFCVGQDLKEHMETLGLRDSGTPDPAVQADRADRLFRTVPDHYNPLVTALLTMPKPVVAAVNGVAAGAGASLAFACDLRVLAHGAGFNLAFAGIGLSCDTGSSWTLPALVGRAKALELLYFPRTIPSEECLELGLATKVVPADALAEEVRQLARGLAAGPTQAYGAIRRSVAHSASHDLASSLAFEAEMMTMTGGTRDHRAAVESFVAKQKPVFEGR